MADTFFALFTLNVAEQVASNTEELAKIKHEVEANKASGDTHARALCDILFESGAHQDQAIKRLLTLGAETAKAGQDLVSCCRILSSALETSVSALREENSTLRTDIAALQKVRLEDQSRFRRQLQQLRREVALLRAAAEDSGSSSSSSSSESCEHLGKRQRCT